MNSPATPKPDSQSRSRVLLVVLISLLAAIIFIPIILEAIYQIQLVRNLGQSMSPAVNNDDRLFVERSFKTINRGDIVLFYYLGRHNESFIKRVIGLPGETIAIHESVVLIDGKVLNEPYVAREHSRLPYEYRLTLIPEDYYFVMGDNRDASNDSRDFGPVDGKLIYAKVIGRYWTADSK